MEHSLSNVAASAASRGPRTTAVIHSLRSYKDQRERLLPLGELHSREALPKRLPAALRRSWALLAANRSLLFPTSQRAQG